MNSRNGPATATIQFASSFSVFTAAEKFHIAGKGDSQGAYFLKNPAWDSPYLFQTDPASGGYALKCWVGLPAGMEQFQFNIHYAAHFAYLLSEHHLPKDQRPFLPLPEWSVFSDWCYGILNQNTPPFPETEIFNHPEGGRNATEFFKTITQKKVTGADLLFSRILFLTQLRAFKAGRPIPQQELKRAWNTFLDGLGFGVSLPPLSVESRELILKYLKEGKNFSLDHLARAFTRLKVTKFYRGVEPISRAPILSPSTQIPTREEVERDLASLPNLESLIFNTQKGDTGEAILKLLIGGIGQIHYIYKRPIGVKFPLDGMEISVLAYFFLANEHTDSQGSYIVGIDPKNPVAGENFFSTFVENLLKN